jgi:hypothetical protein
LTSRSRALDDEVTGRANRLRRSPRAALKYQKGAGERPAAFSALKKEEPTMKLNAEQITKTLNQLPVELLPEDHPIVPQLNRLFGDHTFFLGQSGLSIVESAADLMGPSSADIGQTGMVVNVASWTDSNPPKLEAHEPELTGSTVALDVQDGDGTRRQ